MLKWIRSLFRRRPAPQPTAPGYEWYNAVQEELYSLLSGEGGRSPQPSPNPGDGGQ